MEPDAEKVCVVCGKGDHPKQPLKSAKDGWRCLKHYWGSATINTAHAVGRNAACPCGSGQKFKKCHGRPQSVVPVAPEPKDTAKAVATLAMLSAISAGGSPP